MPANGSEAVAMQKVLRGKLRITNDFGNIKTVLGVDVGYNMRTSMSRASVVLMSAERMEVLQTVLKESPTTFPYIPGLLSFREIPAILVALHELQQKPDLLMVDGQGIAHPRRMGIAAHLGVLLDIPAIGVAKSRLCGEYEEPDSTKGSASPLYHHHEHIGTVLRSRDGVKPLFISPGHRVGVPESVALVQAFLTRYRLPEPTRLADKYSKTRHS
jgi:deoxyribonuclease V